MKTKLEQIQGKQITLKIVKGMRNNKQKKVEVNSQKGVETKRLG